MNINLMRLRPAVKELRGIRSALERIAECMEADLATQGYNINIARTDTSKPESSISYIDEELDYLRENVDHLRREDERKLKEEADNETGGLDVFGKGTAE